MANLTSEAAQYFSDTDDTDILNTWSVQQSTAQTNEQRRGVLLRQFNPGETGFSAEALCLPLLRHSPVVRSRWMSQAFK